MIKPLIKNWWLLALCGVLDAIISVIYLIRQDTDAAVSFHAWHGTVVFLGKLTLAAGACTIAASVWNSRKSKSWLLVLNGLACSALGLIFIFQTRIAFRTIALLIVLMAMSIGIYELAIARPSRRHSADAWLLGAAGVASVGLALAFFAFVLHWIKLDPASPTQSLHWLGAYFGVSAISMLILAVGRSQSGLWQAFAHH